MANFQGTQAAAASYFPTPTPDGQADLIAVFGDLVLPAGTASGDIFEVCPLPPNCVVVDLIVDTEDFGTTFTADVGIMSGTWGQAGTRTCGAQFMTGKAFGTAGIYRADVAGFGRLAPSTDVRSIGVAGTTIGTPTTGARLRITALVRPQVEGV